jgi:hypothetical protein
MPQVNFTQVTEKNSSGKLPPIPEGRYRVRVEDIKERTSQAGNETWGLKLVVTAGPQKGRVVWDNITFSPEALGRVKLVCSRLGLDVSKDIFIKPEDLKNREVFIETQVDTYTNKEGKIESKNIVPFAGYIGIENEENEADQIPF